jgi:hypothetical protein
MGLTLSLPLSINQPQDQYRTPGSRRLIMKLIRFESLHYPEAGQTTMSASLGLIRCLIAVQRLKLNIPTDYLSLMGADLTSRWILLGTAIRTRFSLLYMLLTRPKTLQPLATGYSKEVAGSMERSQGLTSMSERDVFPLFYRAWQASFKEATMLTDLLRRQTQSLTS